MAQHFLLSAAARTLSLKASFAGGEEAAYWRFCRLRWPKTEGDPVCPMGADGGHVSISLSVASEGLAVSRASATG